MTRHIFRAFILFFIMIPGAFLFAAGSLPGGAAEHAGDDLTHRMTMLVLQIGVILFAGYAGAVAARRIRIPAILGELIAGILIGPYVLGNLPLPLYPSGLFPPYSNSLSISPELWGFAVVASIVLLFLTGLQTDLRLFLRFAFKGSLVGLGGALLSMAGGVTVGVLFLGSGPLDPRNLFLGVVAISTSVDITARILSERRRMASAEGVTILSASVIEDVIGITLLAVVLGIEAIETGGGSAWRNILSVGGRALGVWIGFTTFGVLFSRRLSGLLKAVTSPPQIAVLSLGFAFIVSGLFEAAGIAMIIGAYVAGLSLADTDIAYLVQEKIETVHQFFDPVFFTVIGMIVNVHVLFSAEVAGFGLLFGLLAWASKVAGCSIPALFLGFTRKGAFRVGLGMVPRGEVALIISTIGIRAGILDDRLFGIIIFMTLMTTLSAPSLLNRLLMNNSRATVRDFESEVTVAADFDLGSADLTRYLIADVVQAMRGEGFFVNASEGERKIYQMRRETVFITMAAGETGLHFTARPEDITLINSLIYESILALNERIGRLKDLSKPVELGRALVAEKNRALVDWYKYLSEDCIELNLAADAKEDAIRELTETLARAGKITDTESVLEGVFARERTMSTGMQHGVAIPHGRSPAVRELSIAVGLKPGGLDFQSLDGLPAKIIFLVVSPENNSGPHLQILAGIAGIMNSAAARDDILSIGTPRRLIEYMVNHSNAG